MEITITERSQYLRGVLILIRKDREITEPERQLVQRIGGVLGFHAEFTRESIDSALANLHLSEEVPVFSSPGVAEMFLLDCLTISTFGKRSHSSETEWIERVALANNIGGEALTKVWLQTRQSHLRRLPLEVDKLMAKTKSEH